MILLEGYHFSKNLGFFGTRYTLLASQTLVQLCFILFLILSSVLKTTEDFSGFRYLLLISVISRAYIISVRYGFMSDIRFETLHQNDVGLKWITGDFILKGWLKQNPGLIRSEIEATKNRLSIEEHEFSFNFLQELPPNVAEKFSKVDYYERKNVTSREIKQTLNHHKLFMMAKKKLEREKKGEIGKQNLNLTMCR